MRTDNARPVRLADYRPPNHLVEQVNLDVHLDASATEVAAQLLIRPNPKGAPGAPLVLDRDGIVPVRMMIDGRPLSGPEIVVEDSRIVLPDVPDRPFSLESLTVVDPSANTALSGLYRSSGIFCTQCEAEGFRRITPFPDRPDVLARYRTRVEARTAEARHVLSNGNPVAGGTLPGGRHFAVWDDPHPKPSYLFALVGGNLAVVKDHFVTRSGRGVRLEIYVEEGKEGRCAFAMDALKRSMRWDEEAFGREYDLDVFMIVAVSDFNMGAMENKGLNIFNDKYILALPDTATDADYVNIEAIIAHEYFHNWTGNRITCRDWFQLCLKEGLTVFRDQEFTADMRSRAVERIRDVRNLRDQQFVEDSGPLAHPVRPEIYHEINNFYTATVYEKGAEVIRALKALIGERAFARGMDLYFDRHDGTAATIEEFIACFAEASGRDLRQFMLWYAQAGTPEVTAHGRFDAATQTYQLTFNQTVPPTPGQPVKAPMVIPVALGLVGPDGRDLPLRTADGPLPDGVVVVDGGETTVTFTDIPAAPVPSLLRGFSAPVRLTTPLSADELLFLLANDSDPFNRWQAAQTLETRRLVADCRGGDAGAPSTHAITDALAAVLRDDRLDDAFVALVLQPPSETDIARELASEVDPDAVLAARDGLRGAIATALHAPLRARYDALASSEPYSPDATPSACRALRNTILDLFSATRSREASRLATAQFESADNMTDRLAALVALARIGGPDREAALAAFAERYDGDALALDKWFTVQATIPEAATLDRVKALTRHPRFSFANPNRVRALIGAFAMANPTQFNRADGAGFHYLVDVVLQLDPKNPQLAARLLSAFKAWRALDGSRRPPAQAALERVTAAKTLSADTADIARRSLA
jgi:aminopeptidase N